MLVNIRFFANISGHSFVHIGGFFEQQQEKREDNKRKVQSVLGVAQKEECH